MAVAALFVLFLPFLTAMPVPNALWSFRFPGLPVEIGPYHVMLGGFGIWTWFPSWI